MDQCITTERNEDRKNRRRFIRQGCNEKDRYIFEKEYMNPKKEKYFHESMDGKIHSRVYEEIRTIVEEREDNTEEYDIEWEDDSREDDDLEYADAWDKNDNGIPDYAEDDR